MTAKVKNNSVKAHNAKFRSLKRGVRSVMKANSLRGIKGFAWIHFSEDPIFNDYLFNKFMGMFVKKGKKEKIFKIFYSLFGVSLKKKIPFFLFYCAIDRLKPGVISVPTRSGSHINYVPMPTSDAKAYRIALQFLYKAIKDRRQDNTLQEKIFNEFEAFFKETGYVNHYWNDNNAAAINNSYLRHFRRFGVY